MNNYIQLVREFAKVSESDLQDEQDWGFLLGLRSSKLPTWEELLPKYRTVILAEAGAGKSREFKQQALTQEKNGKISFFIRIEDINADFSSAFEVGNSKKFQQWKESNDEAWFFLDSVDEARLKDPSFFSRALNRFSNEIEPGKDRAHIFISSRPYSWYPRSDRALMDEYLFMTLTGSTESSEDQGPISALEVYKLWPLDEDKIRVYCSSRDVNDIDSLINQIGRVDLWSLAERPFDLDNIIHKWKKDKKLESRLDLLRFNIRARLNESHNAEKAQRDPLNFNLALVGAKRLAAAVVLTGESNIKIPDSNAEEVVGIDAKAVLSDWEPKQVDTLLNRGIFNEIVFSSVRFRHREIKELLAADWFIDLLAERNNTAVIEGLFFKESYGENIVTPKLRPLLPWIVLKDGAILERVIRYYPEIISEGGDPSHLSLTIRKSILIQLVDDIANDGDKPRRDNQSIALLAKPDLSELTKELIIKYKDNDDAIFYLGRLVWQGEMSDCLDLLVDIAHDSNRPDHPRVGSIRAVMTCGTETQKIAMWRRILIDPKIISRELLSELISWAPAEPTYIKLIFETFVKLPKHKKHSGIGLLRQVNRFVQRCNNSHTIQFIEEAQLIVKTPPYMEDIDFAISDNYSWLMSPLSVAVEKLIVAKHPYALTENALSILRKVPRLRFWEGSDYTEDKHQLPTLVPSWPELNDALYWSEVVNAAADKEIDFDTTVPNDASFYGYEHYWKITTADIERLLEQFKNRSRIGEKCVAIFTLYRLLGNDKSNSELLSKLMLLASSDSITEQYLNRYINPVLSKEALEGNKINDEYKKSRTELLKKQELDISNEINEIRSDPDQIVKSMKWELGFHSPVLNKLYQAILRTDNDATIFDAARWKALIPTHGLEVAEAYRHAASLMSKLYVPTLQSEGTEIPSYIPLQIIIGLAGIQIELERNENYFDTLPDDRMQHLLRYLPWGHSHLHFWFKQAYATHPTVALEAVTKELIWELDNRKTENALPYILSKLVFDAPWMHAALAPIIYDWAIKNPVQLNFHHKYCVRIMVNGEIDASKIADLALLQIKNTQDCDNIAWWHAILIDTKPELGIKKLQEWLETLPASAASHAAQVSIITLVGDDNFLGAGPYYGIYKTPQYLKALYLLINRFVPFKEYRARLNGSSYLGGYRGEAEDAMGRVYRALIDMPGKETYLTLKQLAKEITETQVIRELEIKAYEHAVEDGDIFWSAEQVFEFYRTLNIVPRNHKQLFDLAVRRLHELKYDLERSNDSPAEIWKLAPDERAMSTLIVSWLNDHCGLQYVTAKEPELANKQRMDIWLQNMFAKPPVPIELKLLDQNWSGNELCERLRNQLVGDYLREEGASCGVMLLVSQKLDQTRQWNINGNKVTLNELSVALKEYWLSIAHLHPKVEEIQIVVIDLNIRNKVSKT